ncbi:MAG: chromate transporter [Erysipelotrichaceae bacterium]|nr:chromate transporter [Erysipelotrichaceae bacterium]MDD3924765.1 chromate transporter [Erysipelotrichaceae bacterium]MDD4643051.1 chromate transporter [Erysipelotrichaceae bacterium]
MELFKLFLCFFEIGLFSFGGGYAAVPLIQAMVVERYHWLSVSEFINLITIAEMTPGPIVINAATFVGMKIDGFTEAIFTTLGSVMPSFIIVLILSWLYKKYKGLSIVKSILKRIRPLVVAMILSAGFSILVMALFKANDYRIINIDDIQVIELIIFIISLGLLRKYKVNPIMIIFGSGLIGTLSYLLFAMI